MSERSSKLPTSKLLERWLLQHYLFEVWSRFKQNLPIESSLRTGAIILSVDTDGLAMNDEERKLCLLIKFLGRLSAAIHSIDDSNPQPCDVTVLEEAIELLSAIGHTFAGNLNSDAMSELMRELRYTSVLSCCQKGQFEMAEAVFSRQWKQWKNTTEMEKRNELSSLISNRKVSRMRRNAGQSLVQFVIRLFAPLMTDKPFLIEIGLNVARVCAELEAVESSSLLLPGDDAISLPANNTSGNSGTTDAIDTKPNLSVGIFNSPKRVKPSGPVEQLETSESQSSLTDADEAPSRLSSNAARAVKKSARVQPSTRHHESDGSSSELSINFEETSVGQSTNVSNIAKRAKKTPWAKEEEELVYRGVKYFGVGRWAEIKKKYLPKRSNVDVKDKWRTMLKQKGNLLELAKKFGPIHE